MIRKLFRKKENALKKFKQVILLRQDLKLPKGKACAQAAHASVQAVFDSSSYIVDEWHKQGMQKIVLKVDNLNELKKYFKQAKKAHLPASIITDAGHTTVKPGTVTCGAIGPAREEDIDKITGELKLVS